MNRAIESGAQDPKVTARTTSHHAAQARDWRKSMSDNVALALIVYTGLQIFMTVNALKAGFSSILPYVALVFLVGAVIPGCRWFERRWLNLDDSEAHDLQLGGAFRRDQIALWVLAIGLPVLMTAAFKTMF